ncbi:MAG TPA: DNRLRE domain-containing protein [Ignavibacteria bacterium]|nr:DNRLRE domain-containing protein [Ignavibacteria bacterium]HMR40094.1 DNRLRE domain-containing protein [Ignavibacteria bacterium]
MKTILKTSIITFSFFLMFVILTANHSFAATDTLDATADNTLYESAFGSLSNAKGQYFFTGTTLSNLIRRGVINFNVAASIPPGAVITDVKLELHMSKTISDSRRVKLYRITNPWTEGTSQAFGEEGGGIGSQTSDVTWIHTYYDNVFWSNAGGDYDPNESASTNVDQIGFYTWNSAQMNTDVQNWIDGNSQEYGWIIIGDETDFGTAKRFDSRENSDTALRPKLIITYTFSGIALDLKVLNQGFYDNGIAVSDTFRVNLRSSASPYGIIDSSIAYHNTQSWFVFNNAPTGNYYIEVNQRNSINTWSKLPQSFTAGSTSGYDFTTAKSKAYGDNQVLEGGVATIYSGDVNKDGFVNLADVLIVYNGAVAFQTGYVPGDVNGNNIVDLADILITYNNATAFVTVIKP